MLIRSKSIRTALGWQLAVTIVITLIAGLLAGLHGAISTVLGGLVSFLATAVAAVLATLHKDNSAGSVLIAAMRAEAVKIVLIVLLLWLVFVTYKNVVPVLFVGMFIISLLVSGMAFFVRDR
jgi:ATP synthase protein I